MPPTPSSSPSGRRMLSRSSVGFALVMGASLVTLGSLPAGPALASSRSSVPALRASAHAPSSRSKPALRAPRPHLDENGPDGMNVEAAWSAYGTGSPGVTIAYIEGGINWHLPDAASLASVAYVNWHETPVPCEGTTLADATMVLNGVTEACHTVYSDNIANYEIDGATRVNAADWAQDPRVTITNGDGVINPEDLIASFCGPAYDPPVDPLTGLRCDISGWDFYHGQNDPATSDTAYQHANDQMDVLHTECPSCSIMPVRAGNEALDPTDDLAQAWLFACEEGAKVIVSVTADLGYSSFMRQVISYCQSKGVVMVEATNDFDSTDHQGGMYWAHVIPGNGAVENQAGTGWTRSDLTSWGTKATFTVATQGGSTSESTPTTGGIMALLASYGQEAFAEGKIPAPLTGEQLFQILRATATPFTDQTPGLSWQPGPTSSGGWNMQYGYGMPDVYAAAQMIFAGEIPPATSISSPSWYSIYDPTTTSSVPVTGSIVAAAPGDSFTWTLQAATGAQPTNSQWFTIGTGSAEGSYNGNLGTLDLASIPQSFWDATFSLSGPPNQPTIPTSEEYSVTFRLEVTDTTNHTTAEDRRAINVHHDPTLLPGFPLHTQSSLESSPALVDLQGTGKLDIVFADADGTIRAVDPTTGAELPGWPVHTDPVSTPLIIPPGVSPGYQSVLAPVAVGDLEHDGQMDVVVTSLAGSVYVFDAEGKLLPGWPKVMSRGVTAPAIPRPELPHVRAPALGATAPPVLADLLGNHHLEVIQAGWDGYIHVWNANGTDLPGWPVQVNLPADLTIPSGYELEADHTLDTPPAVAYLNGPGRPDLVIRSQQTEILGSGIQPLPSGFVFAYHANGTPVAGWPVTMPGLFEYYGSAMEFVTEGDDAPVAADTNGSGTDQVAVNPIWTPPSLIDGSGQVIGTYGNTSEAISSLLSVFSNPQIAYTPSKLPPDVPIPFTSYGSFGHLGPPGSPLAYAESEIGTSTFAAAELQPNAGLGIDQFMDAYPADQATATEKGSELPGFPALRQGLDFFGQPLFADVSGGGDVSIVSGGDSGAVAAYTSTGAQAPGFPKFTGGWVAFSPSTGDLLSDGHEDLVAGTREGYMFAWSTNGSPAANDQWWHVGHDQWNTDNAGMHTRPPGAMLDARWAPGQTELTFTAPGGRWYEGEVARYEVTYAPSGDTVPVSPSGPAGSTQTIPVPVGTTGIRVEAVNEYDLLSTPLVLGATPPPPAAGYWTVSSSGHVTAYGDAHFYGDPTAGNDLRNGGPGGKVVAAAAAPDRGGYWLASSTGYVYAFGAARFYGSLAGHHLPSPIVAMARAPGGDGYWLAAADGAVYAFGNATNEGSLTAEGVTPASPIVAMTPTSDGNGYWLAAADGAVYAFGDATNEGSLAAEGVTPPSAIVAMTPTSDGNGYWLAAADGAVYAFGDATAIGPSADSTAPALSNPPGPLVGIASLPAGD